MSKEYGAGLVSRLSSVLRRPAAALCAGGCLLSSVLTGCGPQQQAGDVSQDKQQQTVKAPQDKPLAAFQTNLLQTAFNVATAIPVYPHISDRSRAQADTVNLCFELDQPQRALGYIEKIGDWRRGAGYAGYAFYCAQHGVTNDVQRYLNLAEEFSSITDQDWGRDRIHTVISQTQTLLGKTDLAEKYQTGVDVSESGKVARVEATICDDTSFAAQMEALGSLIDSGQLDPVKNALYACAELFNRFYDNTERRSQLEEKIKSSWKPLPVFLRIELLMELSGFAQQHTDQTKARELADEAKTIMDSLAWPPEYYIPFAARLATARFLAGEQDAARSTAAGLLAFYNEHQAEILITDKAKTLCSVAEALKITDSSAAALPVYKQALESGAENPNSRPRAEDLSSICLSLVKHAVEPDAALWARIREIQANLGEPW